MPLVGTLGGSELRVPRSHTKPLLGDGPPTRVESRLYPVADLPVLRIVPERRTAETTLVIADVHLGLGGSRDRPGGPPEADSERLAESVLHAVAETGAAAVIVAGDAKHPIVGTPVPLRPTVFDFFRRLLEQDLRIELVLGNHDVGLVPFLPREVRVHSAQGIVRDGVGIFHGHRWPSNSVLRAPRLVVGHLHPGFRLAATVDDPTGKRRCWVRVRLPPPPPPPRRHRRHVPLRAREIVVLPAFNPIAGIEALNRRRPGRGRSFLWQRFVRRGEGRAYLLDGTDLGVLPTSDRGTEGAPAAWR